MKKLGLLCLITNVVCSSMGEPDMVRQLFFEPINDKTLVILFPQTIEEITARVSLVKQLLADEIRAILAIPVEKRTFDNTAQAFDSLTKRFQRVNDPLEELEKLSPNAELRAAAHAGLIELNDVLQHDITKNVDLFKAFKCYFDGNAKEESLDNEQRYYLQETIEKFMRMGLMLLPDQLAQVQKLEHEIFELELQFQQNINNDATTVPCTAIELEGASASVLTRLKKNDKGQYIVGVDYPTYFALSKSVNDAQMRKKLYQAFVNRAYPANIEILKHLIIKRNELAKLLGFASYADYDLASTMAKTPAAVMIFLNDLAQRVQAKSDHEAQELHTFVPTQSDGPIQPWDIEYLKEQYRAKHFAVDTAKVAEYFPVESVIAQALKIYENFLGLRFEPLKITGLWHESVLCFKTWDAAGQLRGYLLLDLYPRPNKYSHACMDWIVSTVKSVSGTIEPAVITVIANFTPGTEEHSGLLTSDEVRTFFHEFGHAMHGMVGATRMMRFSGTAVKRDFVEVPSQMFEVWPFEREVLKKLSKHYKTGQTLPDDIIDQLTRLARFDVGDERQRLIARSLYSLTIYQKSMSDLQGYYQELFQQMRSHVPGDDRAPSNFGHLAQAGYGAKYYSYLWAEVFSIDLFSEIKKRGLFDPAVGKDLVDKVLGKGGSAEPAQLLEDFLGRPANQEAFLKYYGL